MCVTESVATTIVSTGAELLHGRTEDANSAFLARELSLRGFRIRRLLIVGDDPRALRADLERCVSDSGLILLTGGLGPTADDRTRRAVARAVGRELVEDADSRRHVERRLAAYGHQAGQRQLTQALFPAGSRIFPNERGTARGFACCADGTWLAAMPGVPEEMRQMFGQAVLPFLLEEFTPEQEMRVETLHLFPMAESTADERVRDLTQDGRNPYVGITVSDGIITLSVSAVAESVKEVEELVQRDVAVLKERFGERVFGTGDDTLATALRDELRAGGLTLAVAESLTGGLIGHMLVDVPGMSEFFLGDVVAYGNEMKIDAVAVPRSEIVEHGAVSPEVARSMARGVCRMAGSKVGLATTGIAGPTGGTGEKPVGLVYVGVCVEGRTAVQKLNLRGDRWRIKDRAARHALNAARLALRNGVDAVGRTWNEENAEGKR